MTLIPDKYQCKKCPNCGGEMTSMQAKRLSSVFVFVGGVHKRSGYMCYNCGHCVQEKEG